MSVVFKPIKSNYYLQSLFNEFVGLLVKDFIVLHRNDTNSIFNDLEVIMNGESGQDKDNICYITFDENSLENKKFIKARKYDQDNQFCIDYNINLRIKRNKDSLFVIDKMSNYLIQALCFNTNSATEPIIFSKTINSAFGSKTLNSDLQLNSLEDIKTQETITETMKIINIKMSIWVNN